MSKGTPMFLAALLAAASLALGCQGRDSETVEVEAADVEVADDVERYKVPITGNEPSKGPEDALVTIVEFSEFQCPFCARVLPTVKQIEDTYGDDVRIVWRNLPLGFHQNADPAAQLAMEAYAQGGDVKFWEVHDLLFANQKALSRADLENYAQQAGLDMDKVKAALDGKAHSEADRRGLHPGRHDGCTRNAELLREWAQRPWRGPVRFVPDRDRRRDRDGEEAPGARASPRPRCTRPSRRTASRRRRRRSPSRSPGQPDPNGRLQGASRRR